MLRALTQQTIAASNAPQPLFFTTLASAISPAPDLRGITPGGYLPSVLSVVSAAGFRVGDPVMLMQSSSPYSSQQCFIAGIASNQITVVGLSSTFPASAWLLLAAMVSSATVQPKTGSANMYYYGSGPSFTATAGLFYQAAGSAGPFQSSNIFGANPIGTQEIWIMGTAADTYTPSLVVT